MWGWRAGVHSYGLNWSRGICGYSWHPEPTISWTPQNQAERERGASELWPGRIGGFAWWWSDAASWLGHWNCELRGSPTGEESCVWSIHQSCGRGCSLDGGGMPAHPKLVKDRTSEVEGFSISMPGATFLWWPCGYSLSLMLSSLQGKVPSTSTFHWCDNSVAWDQRHPVASQGHTWSLGLQTQIFCPQAQHSVLDTTF